MRNADWNRSPEVSSDKTDDDVIETSCGGGRGAGRSGERGSGPDNTRILKIRKTHHLLRHWERAFLVVKDLCLQHIRRGHPRLALVCLFEGGEDYQGIQIPW